ncbi:DNA-directed RNA polymerase [Synchytrium endobioticum]|uniref:DNA-directed RNA polymerase subunit n=1 Tax=Synchytrium endobioticum TaxID=286115 RepID=A0A507DKB8_9FUNG|nr:DNA-directed RNA polymerase [Synchytrium endobioticum]
MEVARPISKQVSAVAFSFYSAEEIKKLSVKQITNPILFDTLNHPTKNGLYDPALGPMSAHDICATCNLAYFSCPGHFGHIELAAPCYNPVTFPLMKKLLQITCVYCHRFRHTKIHVALFVARLRLVHAGLILQANQVLYIVPRSVPKADSAKTKAKTSRQELDDEEGEVAETPAGELYEADVLRKIDQYVRDAFDDYKREHGYLPSASTSIKSTHVTKAMREIQREFLASAPLNHCGKCKGASSKFRVEGVRKVFEKKLAAKSALSMAAKGYVREDVFALASNMSKPDDAINGPPSPSLKLHRASFSRASSVDSEAPVEKMTTIQQALGSHSDVSSSNNPRGMYDNMESTFEEIQMEEERAARIAAAEDSAEEKLTPGGSKPTRISAAEVADKTDLREARYVPPIEVRAHLTCLWQREKVLVDLLYGSTAGYASINNVKKQKVSSPDIFFFDLIAVAPSKFRPAAQLLDTVFDHPQNAHLTDILKANSMMGTINKQMKLLRETVAETSDEQQLNATKMAVFMRRMVNAWIALQDGVNGLIDSTKVPAVYGRGKEPPAGVRQILEKKEGLFRKHMMGKRVNYAARSVISPDPYIETNEIGIPPVFATRLTYPEPVTQHNAQVLRAAVMNGPYVWPGATHVQNEDGSLVSLSQFNDTSRAAIAQTLLTPPTLSGKESDGMTAHVNKKVYRHIKNGDFLLLNRQPTLHKPSIMAHTAKILPGEKTLRLHYANCNTYNADFDGDEMNAHFPQSELGRAEAMVIARTDQQYLVPTAGDVLRGLIQDHVDAGVGLTSRDTFLSREEFMQLLYVGLQPESRSSNAAVGNNNGLNGVIGLGDGNIETEVVLGEAGKVIMTEPALWKPKPVWTGKQLISAVLLNLTHERHPLNLRSKSKIPAKSWGPTAPEEQTVLVFDGHLLQGRLFTAFLQYRGFSCRMDDLVLTNDGEYARKQLILKSSVIGREAASEYVSILDSNSGINNNSSSSAASLDDARLSLKLEHVLRSNERMAGLDATMKTKTNKATSEIIATCIPDQLLKPFPSNNMQMMTVSGAKGSNVNVSQISCLLGQQELEGRRVPTMVSGKTLPSFRAFDPSARAGGFITGRFLSGIRPQEYYFHCMAGREGLIDTAVKTSRSGYLQRCLIKHLEGATISYDHTVRDTDGSVLQFLYGEDALDVIKQKALTKFDLACLNFATLYDRYQPQEFLNAGVDSETVPSLLKDRERRRRKTAKLGSDGLGVAGSSTSDMFIDVLDKYIKSNPDGLIHAKNTNPKHRWTGDSVSAKHFKALMQLKYMSSLADPGEAVGLLAAQGLGEPSTQMTLNTFHFAGFGAKNVTLGIPRLREIIMTASAKIKTPLMRIPLRADSVSVIPDAIGMLCRKVGRLGISQIMEGLTVREKLRPQEDGKPRRKVITVHIDFWSRNAYESEHGITSTQLKEIMVTRFLYSLETIIKFNLKLKKSPDDDKVGVQLGNFERIATNAGNAEEAEGGEKSDKKRKKRKEAGDINDGHGDDVEVDGGMDATTAKRARNAEQATYEAPDDEDEDIIRSVNKAEEARELLDLDDDDDDNGGSNGSVKSTAKTAPTPATNDETGSAHGDYESNMIDEDDRMTNEEEDEDDNVRGSRSITQAFIDEQLQKRTFAAAFRFDDFRGSWCEIDLEFDAKTKKLLMVDLVEKACRSLVLSEIKGITRCYPLTNESENDTSINLGTEGVNFPGIWELSACLEGQAGGLIDVDKIYTNDVHAVLVTYGVEAARQAIVQEIASVFGVYGISVDMRHLSLIADYMTFEGGYKAFNRTGMGSNPSPFTQMSFETTTAFLMAATFSGDYDALTSPSARLVMGLPVKGGTGSFEVRHKVSMKTRERDST